MNYEDMEQSELRLNCACVDALRHYLGLEPLYDETSNSVGGRRMTVRHLAEKISDADPNVRVQLESRKQGAVLRVFVSTEQVLYHDGRSNPIRDLLPAIEARWGRIWE